MNKLLELIREILRSGNVDRLLVPSHRGYRSRKMMFNLLNEGHSFSLIHSLVNSSFTNPVAQTHDDFPHLGMQSLTFGLLHVG